MELRRFYAPLHHSIEGVLSPVLGSLQDPSSKAIEPSWPLPQQHQRLGRGSTHDAHSQIPCLNPASLSAAIGGADLGQCRLVLLKVPLPSLNDRFGHSRHSRPVLIDVRVDGLDLGFLMAWTKRSPSSFTEIGAGAFSALGVGTHNGVVRVNGAGAWSSSPPANVSKCTPSFVKVRGAEHLLCLTYPGPEFP